MTSHPRDRVTLSPTAQNLIRILIASYFIALAAGIVSATHLAAPFSPLLPDPWAARAGCALVFALAYLIMIGVRLRAAALGLAIVMFAGHVVVAMQTSFAAQLEALWRDLALIGALILTYGEAAPRAYRKRGILKPKAVARRLMPRANAAGVYAPVAPAPSRPIPPAPAPVQAPVPPVRVARQQVVPRGAGSILPLHPATPN